MTLELGMITIDCEDPQRLAEFWTRALDLKVGWDVGEFVLLTPRSGDGTNLGLQRVAEPTPGKNRVHLDFGTPDRAGEVRRLAGLGAKVLGEHAAPGLDWTVLADPEGNQFCVGEGH